MELALYCTAAAVPRTARVLLSAAAIIIVFAIGACLLRAVTATGAFAGGFIAAALYFGGGLRLFAVLVAVFVITWIATRAGYARKQRLRLAEDKTGRTAGQVLANLSVAALCAAVGPVVGPMALVACIGALAEAAADTVSSECGEAWSDRAHLITNLRLVPPGTDGAISLAGTCAGLIAAAMVAVAAVGLHVTTAPTAMAAGAAGFAGSLADSVLGATLEARGVLNNNSVNFLSTLVAAMMAVLVIAGASRLS